MEKSVGLALCASLGLHAAAARGGEGATAKTGEIGAGENAARGEGCSKAAEELLGSVLAEVVRAAETEPKDALVVSVLGPDQDRKRRPLCSSMPCIGQFATVSTMPPDPSFLAQAIAKCLTDPPTAQALSGSVPTRRVLSAALLSIGSTATATLLGSAEAAQAKHVGTPTDHAAPERTAAPSEAFSWVPLSAPLGISFTRSSPRAPEATECLPEWKETSERYRAASAVAMWSLAGVAQLGCDPRGAAELAAEMAGVQGAVASGIKAEIGKRALGDAERAEMAGRVSRVLGACASVRGMALGMLSGPLRGEVPGLGADPKAVLQAALR